MKFVTPSYKVTTFIESNGYGIIKYPVFKKTLQKRKKLSLIFLFRSIMYLYIIPIFNRWKQRNAFRHIWGEAFY